jgi:ribosomal protein S1
MTCFHISSIFLQSLEVGMLIMGCVRTVSKEYMLISLPGRITGRVTANDISDVYSKERSNAVSQQLEDIS